MSLANRIMLGWPIYSDAGALYTPTFSGGSWAAGLPLTNLADRRLAKVARSTDAALTSTTFDTDLLTARYVSLVALPKHTISTAGSVRVRGWSAVPIIDWLTVGDGSWTNVGTPTRTAAATTVNGLPLDLIADNDAGTTDETYRVITFTGNGDKAISFLVKKSSTYASHSVLLFDQTASAAVLNLNIDFTAATPVLTIGGGAGAVLSSVAEGTGWRITVKASSVVAANTNRFLVIPASFQASDTAALYIGDIQAWNLATDPKVTDSGGVAAWPAVAYPTDSVPAADPRYGAAFSAEDALSVPMPFVYIPSAPVTARYWRVGITDTGNAAGYVEVARLCICGGYQPTLNVVYGSTAGWTTATTRVETDGGAAVFNVKRSRRVWTGATDNVPMDEALISPFEFMRSLGLSGQCFFVFDPTDTALMSRRAFLAVQQSLSPLVYAELARYGVPLALIEEI